MSYKLETIWLNVMTSRCNVYLIFIRLIPLWGELYPQGWFSCPMMTLQSWISRILVEGIIWLSTHDADSCCIRIDFNVISLHVFDFCHITWCIKNIFHVIWCIEMKHVLKNSHTVHVAEVSDNTTATRLLCIWLGAFKVN